MNRAYYSVTYQFPGQSPWSFSFDTPARQSKVYLVWASCSGIAGLGADLTQTSHVITEFTYAAGVPPPFVDIAPGLAPAPTFNGTSINFDSNKDFVGRIPIISGIQIQGVAYFATSLGSPSAGYDIEILNVMWAFEFE